MSSPQPTEQHDNNAGNDPDATIVRPEHDPNATVQHVVSGAPGVSGFVAGSRLNNNYRLEKQLGRGGMGEAWKAYDETADRFVVLKFIPKEVQHIQAAVDSVRDSFRKVHELQHQHICPVYGLFTDPDHGLYLVMKFVDGLPLDDYKKAQIEKHGKMSFSDAVQILWGIAKGLDYAHEKKVIHRDIKPQNVMIGKKDGVQIIDFGLAEEIRTSMIKYSEVEMGVAGTRPYMAPEQWRGRLQDARTDQYALAVTAYELFVGHPPFQGSDVGILRECVLNDAPEPIPGLPEHVNAALAKALAKKREDRFENCKAFVKALAEKPKVDADIVQSVGPILASDRASGETPPTAWMPSVTTKPEPEKPKRRTIPERFLWILIVGLFLGALIPFIMLEAGKAKPSAVEKTESLPKPAKPKPATPPLSSEPVEERPQHEKKTDAATTNVAEESSPHEKEFDAVDLIVNKLKRIVDLKRADGKDELYISTRKNVPDKVPGVAEPLPKNFARVNGVRFSAYDRSMACDSWRMENAQVFPCCLPGFIHQSGPCTCTITPEDVKKIAVLKNLQHMHLQEISWTLDDLRTLFNGSHITNLGIGQTAPLPNWDPLDALADLAELAAGGNVLSASNLEAIARKPTLRFVNLHDSHFSPGSMKPLEGNNAIQTLILSSCSGLADEDFESLTKMKGLERLELAECIINESQLLMLAEAKKLRTLGLRGNGLTLSAVEAFKMKRSDVAVNTQGQKEFPVHLEEIPTSTKELMLGDLVWQSVETMHSSPGPKSLSGNPQAKNDKLWLPAPAKLTYKIGKRWKSFTCDGTLALGWGTGFPRRQLYTPGGDKPSAKFVVKGDGKVLYESEILQDTRRISISADVSGVDVLELISNDCGDGGRFDMCMWINPMLKQDAASVVSTALAKEPTYHDLEVETIDWLWKNGNGSIQYTVDGKLKGVGTFQEKPDRFDRLTAVMFWASDRQPRCVFEDGKNLFPCTIPGFVHSDKPAR